MRRITRRFSWFNPIMKLAMLILALSCRLAAADGRQMKGWEIYSWFDLKCSAKPQLQSAPNRDSVCFALVPGTNRRKTADEIRASPIGIAALEKRIARLAAGDDVFWLAPGDPFDVPDAKRGAADPRNRAVTALTRRGVKLVVVGAAP